VEALARTGVGSLTLVDFDEVCISNTNRQLPAFATTIGKSKVAVMTERVRAINPECVVYAREEFFTAVTAEAILSQKFDCVLDAIDSLANKCLLIVRCVQAGTSIVTVGGAGGRRDPTAIKIADLSETSHDPLLQKVRKALRADYGFPSRGRFNVPAVFSPETPILPDGSVCTGERLNCNTGYGTAAFVTGAFGFAAAGCVVKAILSER
jgi:tRNA threonylcarbamoyladenosine dehydratase